MIRMIIVDDEHIILESLKTLIDWESIGVDVTGSADNGAAAIDLAIKQRPDIILSDISMPYISGLEMLETLRRNDIKTEVIFITAYGKFEYAQEAIRYGAFDYILKPIDEKQLLSTVSRCADKVRAGQSEQGTEEQRHLNELILNYLLKGKIPGDAEWDFIKKNGPDSEKFPNAVVAGFLHGKDFIPVLNSENFGSAWTSAPMRAAENLTLFMICFREPPPGLKTVRLLGVTPAARGYTKDVYTALSSTTGLRECFEKAFAQISFALIDAEIHQRKGTVLFANLNKSDASAFPGFDNVCSSISRSVKEGKTEQVKELLYKFFTGFLEKEILYDSSLVELYCIELVDHVYGENEDYINPGDKNNDMPAILAIKKRITACTPEKSSGLYQIFGVLCEIFSDLCGSINNDQIHSSMRLVRQCIRIIHEHYGTDISLSSVAKQLYISPNYLSKTFSAEMGKSFSRYLLEYRINISIKLLRESNDKVYEIADRVGYSDVVHFTKIFKQITGLSPNRYRNQK